LPAALAAVTAAANAHAQPNPADWSALAALPDLSGVVVEFRWVNPHSYPKVVEASGTARKMWSIEMSSPGVLTRSGWSRRTFNPGDKITLKLGPLRNDDAGGIFPRGDPRLRSDHDVQRRAADGVTT
jgi:hypothetical protein